MQCQIHLWIEMGGKRHLVATVEWDHENPWQEFPNRLYGLIRHLSKTAWAMIMRQHPVSMVIEWNPDQQTHMLLYLRQQQSLPSSTDAPPTLSRDLAPPSGPSFLEPESSTLTLVSQPPSKSSQPTSDSSAPSATSRGDTASPSVLPTTAVSCDLSKTSFAIRSRNGEHSPTAKDSRKGGRLSKKKKKPERT